MGRRWYPFTSPQPDASRSRRTTHMGLVHRVVCPFTPQLLLVLINRPRRDDTLSWHWYTAATGGIRPHDLAVASPAPYHSATAHLKVNIHTNQPTKNKLYCYSLTFIVCQSVAFMYHSLIWNRLTVGCELYGECDYYFTCIILHTAILISGPVVEVQSIDFRKMDVCLNYWHFLQNTTVVICTMHFFAAFQPFLCFPQNATF